MSDGKVARDYTSLLTLDDEGKTKALQMFVEFLENVPYFDHVVLLSTKQYWIGLEPIRKFSIYSHVVLPEKEKE